MKAILEFNLPEEQEVFNTTRLGCEYRYLIEDLLQNTFRAVLKYDQTLCNRQLMENEKEVLEAIRDEIYRLAEERGVELI